MKSSAFSLAFTMRFKATRKSLTVLIVTHFCFPGKREQNRLQRRHQSVNATDPKPGHQSQRNAERLEEER